MNNDMYRVIEKVPLGITPIIVPYKRSRGHLLFGRLVGLPGMEEIVRYQLVENFKRYNFFYKKIL